MDKRFEKVIEKLETQSKNAVDTNKKLEVRGEFQVKLLSSINDSGVDGEIAKLGNDIYVYEQ